MVVFGTAFALGTDAESEAVELIHVGIFDNAFAVGNHAFGETADGSLHGAVALGPSTEAEAVGDANTTFAAGQKAIAFADGLGNYANAVGNEGPNAFFTSTTESQAQAVGTFDRTVTFGNGGVALALGGAAAPLKLGNNTAIVVGNGSTATVNYPTGTKTNTVAVAVGKNKTTQK